METLNKNWFAFTLVAVIFGSIGYLLGKQSKMNCPMMNKHHKMMILDDKMKSSKSMFMLKDLDLNDGDIEIDIDSIVESDGKKVKVMVKKTKEIINPFSI